MKQTNHCILNSDQAGQRQCKLYEPTYYMFEQWKPYELDPYIE